MKHLCCQATAAVIAFLITGQAAAHWTIASTLTRSDGAFQVTVHYEVLAGQSNPDEPLRICFWLERHEHGRFAPITGQACHRLTLKAAEWRTLVYRAEQLQWLRESEGKLPHPRGQYRAVAAIGSDVSFLGRLIWGATEERKVLPFEMKE